MSTCMGTHNLNFSTSLHAGATVSLSASIPINFTVIEEDLGNDTDLQFCVQLDDDAGGLERDIDLFIVPNVMSSAGGIIINSLWLLPVY